MAKRRERARARGAVHIWAVGAMLPILLLAAIAIDTGNILVARTQLQGALDAGVLVAMRQLQIGNDRTQAETAARSLVAQNLILGNPMQSTLVEFGDYDFRRDRFRAGRNRRALAVRVTGSHSFPFLLGSAFVSGLPSVNGEAIAAAGCREIVLMQDVTASWGGDFADSIRGLRDIVADVAGDGLRGDKIGLGVFAAVAAPIFQVLRPMPAAETQLDTVLDRLIAPCADFALATGAPFLPVGGCSGTDHAAAIDVAIDIFARRTSRCGPERLLILVSDGAPCDVQGPGGTEAAAVAAADRAAAAGISISPVMLLDHDGGVPDCPAAAAADDLFNASLARGIGESQTTTIAGDLRNILPALVRSAPARLVR